MQKIPFFIKTPIKGNVFFQAGILFFAVVFLLIPAGATGNVIRAQPDYEELAPNDDNSTARVDLGFRINFYGERFASLYVNNNGNVTFDNSLQTYTPFDLTSTGRKIIAPFFADVDTTQGGIVRYGKKVIGGKNAFVVTWDNVGYFGGGEKRNTFQVVLIDRVDISPGDFDIEFNFKKIAWETGDESGGNDGLGGNSARVGYSNGTREEGTYFEFSGSAQPGAFPDGGKYALVKHKNARSRIPGRYIFTVRGGKVDPPPKKVRFKVTDNKDGRSAVVNWQNYNNTARGTAIEAYLVFVSQKSFALRPPDVSSPTLTVRGTADKSAEITSMVFARRHYITVLARDIYGRYSNDYQVIEITPADEVNPPAPINLQASLLSNKQAILSWETATETLWDVDRYKIFLNGVLKETLVAGEAQVRYRLKGLDTRRLYKVTLNSVDAAGNTSDDAAITFATPYLHPDNLAVVAALNKKVTLAWKAPVKRDGIAKYLVYVSDRKITDVTGMTPSASVAKEATSTVISPLNNGQEYFFAITSVNISGYESKQVTSVSATPIDTLPPGDAIGFSAATVGFNDIVLTWQPPADDPEDVDKYHLYVNNTRYKKLAADTVDYHLTGLQPASRYTVKLVSVDATGRRSDGVELDVTTLYPNPKGVRIVSETSNRVGLSWLAPTDLNANLEGIRSFVVYVNKQPFTSVEGLTPYALVAKAKAATAIGGLTNGQDYYFAVTVITTHGHESKAVVPVKGTPAAETDGPEITAVSYGGHNFNQGFIATGDAPICVQLRDASPVSRAIFFIDQQPVATDSSGEDGYCYAIKLTGLTDGKHTFALKAYDVYENVSVQQVNFRVRLALPDAPQISSPVDGYRTPRSRIEVSGTTLAQLDVQWRVNGAELAWQPVGTTGRFTRNIVLAEGDNTLAVRARNRAGRSGYSAPLTVVLDSRLPARPLGLRAEGLENGQVRLQWTMDIPADYQGFNVYRSDAPFANSETATRINNTLITAGQFDDVLPEDGAYYYRVASVNTLGTQSALSSGVRVVADATPPLAESIVYSTDGAFDPVTQTYGRGLLTVLLTVSEPLLTTPFLSLAVEGGVPLGIPLARVEDNHQQYQGAIVLDENTASGVAYAVFSGRDRYGNRGTDITTGGQLIIDTQGPRIITLTTSPAAPIKNDQANPVNVTVDFALDEALPAGGVPQLAYRLSHTHTDLVPLQGLINTSANQWRGEFILPGDAGLAQAENLAFAFLAWDALNNPGNKIAGGADGQVYQGDLPPLAAPVNFRGYALPNGRVQLAWLAVEGAVAYQLHRKAPGQSDFTAYRRLPVGGHHRDRTHLDGQYQYKLASVRQHNGQESLSTFSGAVTVSTDSQAPDTPKNLRLALFPTGIQAQWEAVPGNGVSYRLYRAANGPITATDALTPVLDKLPQPLAMDTGASHLFPAYAVVAVDSAGNESLPSDSAYLNSDLLPVSALKVRLEHGGVPRLEWQHNRDTIDQFAVYLGRDENGIQLHTDVLKQRFYIDTGYGNNARDYAVVAIDSNAQRSIARTITLPRIAMALTDKLIVKRHLIDTLAVAVSNHSPEDIDNVRIKIVSEQATFQSQKITLQGGQTQTVPVTVAGISVLPDTWNVSLTMHAEPNPGEEIEITKDVQIPVQEAALELTLQTADFAPGAKGTLSFELENTGAAPIQLITARNTGRTDSPDIVFSLVDSDNNVLAFSPFRQVFGGDVVTLASTETLATIPAGQRWQSQPVSIDIPANAPDELYLVATIHNLYANRGTGEQVRIEGPVLRQRIVLQATAYRGSVDSIAPAESLGDETIVIRGQAIARTTNSPLANVDLAVCIVAAGFERTFKVQTDANGAYELSYTPQKGESGRYRVSAIHPLLTTRPNQGEFVIRRLTLSPGQFNVAMPYSRDYVLPVGLEAGEGTVLNNVHFKVRAKDQPAGQLPKGLTITLPLATQLGTGQRLTREISLRADKSAADNGQLLIAVFADAHLNAPLAMLDIRYRLSPATPAPRHTPGVVELGSTLTGSATASVTLENRGLAAWRAVNVTIKTDDGFPPPKWLKIMTPANLGNIAVGGEKTIDIRLQPNNAAPVGNRRFNLEVQAANAPRYLIPLYTAVSESGKGGVLLKVTDMYSGTLDDPGRVIQGLPDAQVRIQNEALPAIEYNVSTDQLGEAFVEDIPAGRYSIWVAAPNYQAVHIQARIQPGLIASSQVFMDFNLITLAWKVDEISLKDRYNTTLKTTFQTDVPAAVVMLEPTTIALPAMAVGDVFHGQLTLTNYGLIRAHDVNFTPQPSDDFFQFDYLTDVVPETLDAKAVVVIPYKVTALKSLEQQDASGGGCTAYYNCAAVDAVSFCPTGVADTHSGSCFTRSYGRCGGGGDNFDRGGGAHGGSGFGGGGVGSGVSPLFGGFPLCRDGGPGCRR